MKSKQILRSAVTGMVLCGLVLPTLSQAQVGQMKRAASSTGDMAMMPARQFSCDTIDTMRANALAKLTERAGTITGSVTNRRTQMEAQKSARLAALADAREKNNSEREARYDSMRAKATTDEQKAAVETFASTVESLVDDREEAIDAAIATFETGVASLQSSQGTTVDGLASEIEESLGDIYDAAKASCTETSTAAEVRADIMEGMQTMKEEHQAQRETYSFKTEFEALRAARQAAEKAAMESFKSGLQKATDTLKSSMSY